ncbi:putative ABC transporter permease subunit [Alkaliphilus crotonatoxidans]
MNRMLSLIKTNLRVNLGISAIKYSARTNKKKLLNYGLVLIAVAVGIGSLMALYSVLMNEIYFAASQLNQPELVITISFLAAQILVLLFGFFYVMSVFYFSQDLDLLVPLPLRPYEVLGSKFVGIMFYEYLTLLPILLPPLWIYGRGTNQGIIYWIKGLLVALASPVLPLVLATLIVVILMRFINLKKRKDLLAVLGGIAVFLFAMGFNLFVGNRLEGMDQAYFQRLLSGQMDLIKLVGQRFPPSIWATLGITQDGAMGLGYLALFMLASALLFLFLLWISNLIFYRGLLSGQETNRNRKVLTSEEINKKYNQSKSPVMAIFWREWRLMLRTPVYVLNGLIGAILGPIMIILVLFSGQQEGFQQMLMLVHSIPPIYLVLIASAFIIFSSSMNVVAATTISREGKDFWISKMIPMAPRSQIKGKLLHSLAINCITIFASLIALVVVFRLPLQETLIILILSFLGSFLMILVGIIIDLIRPKLEWTNPQEAVKQNLNVFFHMLATAAFLLLCFLLTRLLLKTNVSPLVIYLIFALIILGLSIIGLSMLYRLADKKYQRLEA